MRIKRWIRVALGGALGYDGCMHCKMPWRYVAGEKIMYSSSESMTPLCIRCFEGLPAKRIDVYIKQTVRRWGLDKEVADGIIASARKEVRRMKGSLSAKSLKI